jgi:hypothetical protein
MNREPPGQQYISIDARLSYSVLKFMPAEEKKNSLMRT